MSNPWQSQELPPVLASDSMNISFPNKHEVIVAEQYSAF